MGVVVKHYNYTVIDPIFARQQKHILERIN